MTDDWGKRREEIRKLRAARLAKAGNSTNVVQFPSKPEPDEGLPAELAEAIPTASFTEEEKEDVAEHIQSADQQIEALVKGIDILRAYDMWIGKMKPSPSPGSSEVFISCPLPGHEDKNPSACANIDENVWMCYRCQDGGDVLDLAAIRYDMPDYKTGQNFHNLYRKIAENDFGWTFENENGFQVGSSPEAQQKKYEAAQQQLEDERAQLRQQQGELPPKNVIDINTGEEVDEDEEEVDPHFGDPFKLDWGPLVKEGTFLDEYMKACCVDFVPEEFHFWNALIALGFAGGRNVKFEETHPNLFVCHIGPTAGGKSTSVKPLQKVLDATFPFDPDAPDRSGVYQLPTGASGEFIIGELRGEYKPAPKGQAALVPMNHEPGRIKGLINYSELAEILKRITRQGSTIQETLFKFYDCDEKVDTGSRTGGVLVAKEPFASLVTTTQPARLRRQLTKDDAYSGFLNRFIFTAGPQKPKPTRGRTSINVDKAIAKLKGVSLWIEQVHNNDLVLDWSEDAGDIWDEFCHKTIHPTELAGSETVKRINTVMIKLVTIFSVNAMESSVSKDSVEKAIKLWDYLLKTFQIVDSQVMTSSIAEMEDDVLAYTKRKLIAGKPYVTAAEICKDLKRKYERSDLMRAIDVLLRIGELEDLPKTELQTGQKGRPPKTAYKVRSLLA